MTILKLIHCFSVIIFQWIDCTYKKEQPDWSCLQRWTSYNGLGAHEWAQVYFRSIRENHSGVWKLHLFFFQFSISVVKPKVPHLLNIIIWYNLKELLASSLTFFLFKRKDTFSLIWFFKKIACYLPSLQN